MAVEIPVERGGKSGRLLPGQAPKAIEFALSTDTDQCVLWPGATAKGYGQMSAGGEIYHAHRVVCQRAHGAPPTESDDASHTCGVRLCVNPRHLTWESRAANLARTVEHGTSNRGERCGTSKLTKSEVLTIRADPRLLREIAAAYDVSESAVSLVKLRKTWAHL